MENENLHTTTVQSNECRNRIYQRKKRKTETEAKIKKKKNERAGALC